MHHSRSANVHFMGKWRQGLNIDRGATKQRTVLFNLIQEFYPAQSSSSTKNSLSQLFSQFCIIPGQQMSTLWANGERGLKSTAGQQSNGQYSLTSNKNFTKPHHPLQEKTCLVCIFSQFCFTPGEQMSTLWRNGDTGLKSTSWQESSGQYSSTSNKKFTQPNHPLQQKIRFVSFFHNFASFQVNTCPLYGQMETGA